jgi:hypothetical protein
LVVGDLSPPSLVTITLKALANFSPGFALKPWVKNVHEILGNSEGVAKALQLANGDATPSELRLQEINARSQGCQCATLGWN